MALNPAVLRSSFEVVIGRKPDLTMRFYEILFERQPQLRPLFHRSERKNQVKMLASSLLAVLDHLENAPWLVDTLGAMGAKLLEYEVTAEMYPLIGDALLATLAEVAGSDWTPDVQEAWTDAYGAIAGLMLQGASRAG